MHKLIYIINQYSQNDASHFYHIGNLIEEMAEKGVDVATIVIKGNTAPLFKNKNIKTYVIGSKGLLAYFELFHLIFKLTKSNYNRIFVRIAAVPLIVSYLAGFLNHAETYLWQSGTVYEFDMEQPFSIKKLIWYIKSFIPNWLARKLTNHFVTGPEYMGEYYSRVVGVDAKKIKILYNDINLDRFHSKQGEPDTKIGTDNNPIKLLMVHRLSPVRKTSYYLPYIVESLNKNYPNLKFHLTIVGGGDERTELEHNIKKFELSHLITLTGSIPNEKITKYYEEADIFIQPSYNEGFPRVVLEAMASGLPIVATDAGGTHQIVGKLQQEQIVSRDDRDAFVTVLANLIGDAELREKIIQENLNTVKRFSTPVIADMYVREIFHD